jgi:hypothetical protein
MSIATELSGSLRRGLTSGLPELANDQHIRRDRRWLSPWLKLLGGASLSRHCDHCYGRSPNPCGSQRV